MTAPTTQVTTSEYVVLGQNEDQSWTVLDRVTARDHKTAVRAVAAASIDAHSRYIATPVRSWNPVTVSKKIETTFVVEDVA